MDTLLEAMLDNFAELEIQLEAWASSGPEGMTKDEARRFKAACLSRDRVERAFRKLQKAAKSLGKQDMYNEAV